MSFFENYDPEKAKSSWPAGSYEASITKVEESISKEHGDKGREHGDPMLIVTYEIYGAGPTKGQTITLKDYFTDPPKECAKKGSLWKLRALCTVTDLYEKFKAKTLRRADLQGKTLIVNLSSSYDEKFGDQNKIDSYGKLERLSSPVAAGAEDDDVPF